jgi:hypothetical protein
VHKNEELAPQDHRLLDATCSMNHMEQLSIFHKKLSSSMNEVQSDVIGAHVLVVVNKTI